MAIDATETQDTKGKGSIFHATLPRRARGGAA